MSTKQIFVYGLYISAFHIIFYLLRHIFLLFIFPLSVVCTVLHLTTRWVFSVHALRVASSAYTETLSDLSTSTDKMRGLRVLKLPPLSTRVLNLARTNPRGLRSWCRPESNRHNVTSPARRAGLYRAGSSLLGPFVRLTHVVSFFRSISRRPFVPRAEPHSAAPESRRWSDF